MISNEDKSTVDVGVGAKYSLTDNLALRCDFRDNVVTKFLTDTHNDFSLTAGLVFSFGGKRPVKIASKPIPIIIPPTVQTTDPANAAIVASLNSPVSASFSVAMDPATLNSATMTVTGPDGRLVAGRVTYAGITAAFTPTNAFESNTVYTVTITTGAEDLAGHALVANYSWTFTTAARPEVRSTVPMNAATGVAATSTCTATFTKEMDPASLNTTTMLLTGPGTNPVAGAVTYVGRTATFTPANPLAANTMYTVTITTGAKDPAGNNLAGNYTWIFTTARLPEVRSTVPMNTATGVPLNSTCTATFTKEMDPASLNTTTMLLTGPDTTRLPAP